MFSSEEKQFLLSLARRAIAHYLATGEILEIDPAELPDNLKEKRACFVTLTINRRLRGCIGHLLPIQELYKDVIENAAAAAFHDPRFLPLTPNELSQIKIEISVLTIPQPLDFSSPDDLIAKLRPGIDGVILKSNKDARPCVSTFLPQVWEELKTPEEFLGHLCQKAGLSSSCWREEGIRVEVYQVEKIEERV